MGEDIAEDRRHIEFLPNSSENPDKIIDDGFIVAAGASMSYSSTSWI